MKKKYFSKRPVLNKELGISIRYYCGGAVAVVRSLEKNTKNN